MVEMVEMALEFSELVHNQCENVPHNIGMKLSEIALKHLTAEEENRYFVFFYYSDSNTKMGNGSVWIETKGRFPSNTEIKMKASLDTEYTRNQIVVTGWKEMSQSDYESFTDKDI